MESTHYLSHLTLQDRNHCLNGFALGFADLVLAGEQYNLSIYAKDPMYQRVLKRLSLHSWRNFVGYLTGLQNNPERLQRELAPIFHEIVEEQLNEETAYKVIENLFITYVLGRWGIKLCDAGTADSLFRQFPFLDQEFYQIGKVVFSIQRNPKDGISTLEATIKKHCSEQLKKWWVNKGFQRTLGSEMNLALLSTVFKISASTVIQTPLDSNKQEVIPQIILRQKSDGQWQYLQHPRFGKMKFVPLKPTYLQNVPEQQPSPCKKTRVSESTIGREQNSEMNAILPASTLQKH